MLSNHVTFLFLYKAKIHPISFFHFKTSKRMAGAAAANAAATTSNLDLFDFIESLEREEKYSTTTTTAAAAATAATPSNTNIDDTAIFDSASSIISNQDLETVDVWQDIAEALNNWSERILSIESRYTNKLSKNN